MEELGKGGSIRNIEEGNLLSVVIEIMDQQVQLQRSTVKAKVLYLLNVLRLSLIFPATQSIPHFEIKHCSCVMYMPSIYIL